MSTIPIVDCSKIHAALGEICNSREFHVFVKELGDGMTSSGFVYFVNHQVDMPKIDAALDSSLQFFRLPQATKLSYKKPDPVADYFGYTSPDEEILNESDKTTVEIKEAFDFWGEGAFDESRYPQEVPQLFSAIKDFKESLVLFTEKILCALAIHLGLQDKNFFLGNHRSFLQDSSIPSFNNCRINFYPKLPGGSAEVPPGTMRLTEHQDWGTLTFLYQDDVGGLEAKLPSGQWIPVTPVPGGLVLNAGLMLEMWSGGRFHAAPHRVKFIPGSSEKTRQSLVFFLQPDNHVNCSPLLPEDPSWSPTYPKMPPNQTFLDYYRDRIRGTRQY